MLYICTRRLFLILVSHREATPSMSSLKNNSRLLPYCRLCQYRHSEHSKHLLILCRTSSAHISPHYATINHTPQQRTIPRRFCLHYTTPTQHNITTQHTPVHPSLQAWQRLGLPSSHREPNLGKISKGNIL